MATFTEWIRQDFPTLHLGETWVQQMLVSIPGTGTSRFQTIKNALLDTNLLDIVDAGHSTASELINETERSTLKGPFLVQVMDVQNIEASIERRHDVNVKRTMKLVLSDGYQEFQAVEQVFCPQLTPIQPGCKVRIPLGPYLTSAMHI